MHSRILQLGRLDYPTALALQQRLQRQRIAGEIGDTFLLVEHPRTISSGRRPAEADFLKPPEQLKKQGFHIAQVARGGKLTYHGPGQLVIYFIVSLQRRKLGELVYGIEHLLIETLKYFNLAAERRQGYPGVWTQGRKIASLGLAIQREVSMHGAALNVCPELKDFSVIVPCGMEDCEMTSMARELGKDVDMWGVQSVWIQQFKKFWDPEAIIVEKDLYVPGALL